MQTRERIHQLVDELPERQLSSVEQFLADLQAARSSARLASEDAPEDDEPLTPEETAAINEAYADIASGRTISDGELWRRLGHDPAN